MIVEARNNSGVLLHALAVNAGLCEHLDVGKNVLSRALDILLQECWNKGEKPCEVSITIKPEAGTVKSNGFVAVGSLPQDSHFEYLGKVTSRGGIACFNEDGCFGLDPDTLVIPRPDVDANVVHVGGTPAEPVPA